MIVYIHGFNSSSQSGKAREMAQWMAERGLSDAYFAPDLPDRPAQAIALLEDAVHAARGPVKLVGSSLGGFYATWLAEQHDLKAVLINPCVSCDAKLATAVGKVQRNWHDGSEYVFSAAHHAELVALRVAAPRRPANYLLLVEAGDSVLDYREAVDYYAGVRQVVLEGGDHGFSRFTDYLPDILAF